MSCTIENIDSRAGEISRDFFRMISGLTKSANHNFDKAFIRKHIPDILKSYGFNADEVLRSTELSSKMDELFKTAIDKLPPAFTRLSRNGKTLPEYLLENFDNFKPSVALDKSNNVRTVETKTLYDEDDLNGINKGENFMTAFYGTAGVVKNKMQQDFLKEVIKATVLDVEEETSVSNAAGLNAGLRKYQERLWSIVVRYARRNGADPDLFVNSGRLLSLYNGSKYSGAFTEKVKLELNKILSPKFISSYAISEQYKKSFTNAESKQFVDAYNAYFILTHFDDLLKTVFSKSIDIKDFGHFGNDKYSLTGSTANNGTSWGDKEILTPDDVIDDVLKSLIKVSPRYYWQESKAIDGQYLDVNSFHNTIAKIKNLNADHIVFDFNTIDTLKKNGSKLGNGDVFKFFEDNGLYEPNTIPTSLGDLINSVRDNSTIKYKLIFDLLSDETFLETYGKSLGLEHDKDLIYSIYRNMFSDENSIYSIFKNKSTSGIDYYSYIIADAENTNRINYTQNIITEEGELKTQLLEDYTISQYRSRLNRILSSKWGYNGSKIFMEKMNKDFPIEHITTTEGNEIFNILIPTSGNFIRVQFNSNNLDRNKRYTIQLLDSNKNYIRNISTFTEKEYDELTPFFTKVFGFGFGNAFKNYFSEVSSGFNTATRDALTYAATIYSISYENKNLSRDYTILNITFKNLFGNRDFAPRVTSKDISFTPGNFTAILSRIAQAYTAANGFINKSTLKTSDGKTLSKTSLSQLSLDYRHQFLTQSKTQNSACKHFDIFKNGTDAQFFTGTTVSREFVGRDKKAKPRIEMNVRESFGTQFLFDYLNAIATGSNKINLVPSTNSDKTNVPGIGFNLGVTLPGDTKPFVDFSADEIKLRAKAVFGEYYTNVVNNVISDFNTLKNEFTNSQNSAPREALLKEIRKDKNLRLLIPDEFKLEEALNSINIFDNFTAFNEQLSTKIDGKVIYGANDFIERAIKVYNTNHPNNILEFTDQVHFRNVKGKIEYNRSYISMLYRFDPNYLEPHKNLIDTYFNNDKVGFLTDDYNFWKRSENNLALDLLKSDFHVSMYDDNGKAFGSNYSDATVGNAVFEYLKSNKAYLKNDTGDMWIFKYTYKVDVYNKDTKKVEKQDRTIYVSKLSDLSYLQDIIIDQQSYQKNNATGIRKRLRYITDSKGRDYRNPEFDLNDLEGTVELNPLLKKFTATHYYLTQQFVLATVGSHLAHDAKHNSWSFDDLKTESARFDAQIKRNVINSATMKPFTLGNLNSVPDTYNVAILPDIKRSVFNVAGISDDGIKPYDGATWVNPFIVYLENNSLGGSAPESGFTKKPIVHGFNERTGNAVLIKTATFGLNNAEMKTSLFFQRMMRKSTDIKWRNKDGSIGLFDITKDFNGNDIDFDALNIYFRQDGKIYKLKELRSSGNNTYTKIYSLIDKSGKDTGVTYDSEVVIDSNYKLWSEFGGFNSIEKTNTSWKTSERSITAVVDLMNRIGVREGKSDIRKDSQSNIYQFMKHSDIHYITTMGAVKVGAANINSVNRYTDGESYNFMRVKLHQAGIQLDPEHHADNSTVSLLTQVLTAAAFKGYTGTQANRMYETLSRLANFNIGSLYKAYQKLWNTGNIEDFTLAVTDIATKAVVNTKDKDSIISAVLSKLLSKYRTGVKLTYKDVQGLIPWSDASIFNLVSSKITSLLNNEGIKAKAFGGLNVLCPSEGIHQLFGGKTWGEIAGGDPLKTMQAIITTPPKSFTDPHFAELGKSYKIYYNTSEGEQSEYFKCDSPEDLFKLRKWYNTYSPNETLSAVDASNIGDFVKVTYTDGSTQNILINNELEALALNASNILSVVKFSPSITRIEESLYRETDAINLGGNTYLLEQDHFYILDGRLIYNESEQEVNTSNIKEIVPTGFDLGTSNIYFKSGSGKQYDQWDLASVYIRRQIESYKENLANNEAFADLIRFSNKHNLSTTDILQRANDFINDGGDLDLLKLDQRKQIYKDINNVAFLKLQQDLLKLRDDDIQTSVDILSFDIEGNETIKKINIDKSSLDYKAYDIIVPKLYKTIFGLGDESLNYILSKGSDYFKEKLQKANEVTADEYLYDIVLKTADGKHVYLKHSKSNNVSSDLQHLTFNVFRNHDDTVYRLGHDGSYLQKLSSEKDRIFADDLGNEIIYTDNINYYLDNYKYYDIQMSTVANSHSMQDVLDSLKLSERSENLYNTITSKLGGDKITDISSYASILGDLKVTNKFSEAKLNSLATRMFTSFKKSLELLGARVPAQAQQSFMSMHTVAFADTELNNAYVSRWQIWLQGSDYDVDKVTLMGYAFDRNGNFVGWSDFFKYNTDEHLKVSEKLPFPTGEEVTYQEVDIADNQKLFDLIQPKFNSPEEEERLNKSLINLYDRTKHSTEPLGYENYNKYLRKKYSLKADSNDINEFRKLVNVLNELSADNFNIKIDTLESSTQKEMLDYLKMRLDRHNLYFTHNKNLEDKAALNLIASSLNKISRDAANQIQATSSVDEMIKIPRQIANKESKLSSAESLHTPGNAAVLPRTASDNRVGKNDIAQAASIGEKCFGALTQYSNIVIKSGGPRDFVRLLHHVKLNNNGKPYESHILTNVYIEDPIRLQKLIDNAVDLSLLTKKELLSLSSEQIFASILKASSSMTDAALQISALLSLATDNAKELALSKLNAGEDLIGTYLFGLMIGMDIRDLGNIIISDSGMLLSKRLNGDILYGQDNKRPMQVFKEFEEVPKVDSYLKDSKIKIEFMGTKFEKDKNGSYLYDDKGQRIPVRDSDGKKVKELKRYNGNYMQFLFEAFNLGDRKEYETYNEYNFYRALQYKLKHWAAQDARRTSEEGNWMSIYEYLDRVDSMVKHNISKAMSGDITQYRRYVAHNKYFEKLRQWVEDRLVLERDISNYEDLKTLYQGYNELTKLNMMLKSNQGLKVVMEEKLSFISNIEDIINGRMRELKMFGLTGQYIKSGVSKEFREELRNYEKQYNLLPHEDYTINLELFMQNENYRNLVIDFYDKIKVAFNIYDVVYKAPQYREYLSIANIDNTAHKEMIRYRALKEMSDIVFKEYGIYDLADKKRMISSINSFIDTMISNSWLKTQKPIATKQGTFILGTLEGNAGFLKWMNDIVIPTLKEGNLGDIGYIGSNSFLEALSETTIDKTISREDILTYTLPVSSNAPEGTAERAVLDNYFLDFQKLVGEYYTEKIGSEVNQNSLMDLFFLYNMINFNNRSSQNSITSMLAKVYEGTNFEMAENYYKFISDYDAHGTLKMRPDENPVDSATGELLPIEGDYSKADLLIAVAPNMNGLQAAEKGVPYYYDIDKNGLKRTLIKKLPKEKAPQSEEGMEMPEELYEMEAQLEQEAFDMSDEEEYSRPTLIIPEGYSRVGREYSGEYRSAELELESTLYKPIDINNTDFKNVVRIGNAEIKFNVNDTGAVSISEIHFRNGNVTQHDLMERIHKLSFKDKVEDSIETINPYADLRTLEIPTKDIFINNKLTTIIDSNALVDLFDYIFTNPC